LGSLACFVLIFNPLILDWWQVFTYEPTLYPASAPVPEFSVLKEASAPPQVAPAIVNWWSASITPGILYIGKRFVDWFFDNVMPKRSTA
jgi:hypothetical protein